MAATRKHPRKPSPRICECQRQVWDILPHGFVVLVSPEDEALLRRGCSFTRHFGKWYRVRISAYKNGRQFKETLSRVILKSAPDQIAEHKNRNPFDNQRENLRNSNTSQNKMNTVVRCDSKSGLKGVHKNKYGTFDANCSASGVRRWKRGFKTAEEAHSAYCEMAIQMHGEFFNGGKRG